jgi:RNA polymerase sporulation-specific sigma factor
MQMPEIRAEEHLGLVHLCANRFRDRGIEYEELYSAGCLGLGKAAKAFDGTRGVCFSTYAVPVIIGEIKRLFRDGGSVHTGRRLRSLSQQAQRIAEKLRQQTGREPHIREIAGEMGLTEAETAEALCASLPAVSLTAYTEDGELQTDIPVPSHETALNEHLALEQVLSLLSPADRELIRLRYGCALTQSKTAERLHMTQVQVSRREKKILLFLREELLK